MTDAFVAYMESAIEFVSPFALPIFALFLIIAAFRMLLTIVVCDCDPSDFFIAFCQRFWSKVKSLFIRVLLKLGVIVPADELNSDADPSLEGEEND